MYRWVRLFNIICEKNINYILIKKKLFRVIRIVLNRYIRIYCDIEMIKILKGNNFFFKRNNEFIEKNSR